MLTIYTGHHLEKVSPNINIEPSSLDAPETTIRKATTILNTQKQRPLSSELTTFFFLMQLEPLQWKMICSTQSPSSIYTMTTLAINSNLTKMET